MKRRQISQLVHVLLASAIFLTILVLVYQIVSHHNRRWDLTEDRIHSVSTETSEVLRRMKGHPVTVRGFFADLDPARRRLEVLLKEMATHHPRFHYELFDPDRSPSEANKVRIDAYQTVVVEYAGSSERFQGYEEEDLANAFIRLANPRKRTLCFTTGHGETSLSETERTGFSEWKQVLEDQRYSVKEIQIAKDGIPEECQAVVVMGPRYELLPKELDLLQKYPEKGKGLFLLIDPVDPGEGKSFAELTVPWGLKLGEDVVVDKMSRIFGGDYLVPLVTHLPNHPITERFRVATFLPISRTVRKAPEVPEGIVVEEIAETTPGSWAETDLKRLEAGEAEFDPKADLRGPVPLALAAELTEAPRGARIVVVGDSDFLTNVYVRLSGNKDFSLNILQWLVKDDRWIAIRAKEPRFEPLFLRFHQSVGVAGLTIGVLPLALLVTGSLGIWFRRKKSK